MKKILALFVVLLIIPPFTAYAASITSRSFVVRNTPAAPPASTTPPDFSGEVEQGDTGEEKPEEQGNEVGQDETGERGEAEGELGNFFSDDLNAHEVEQAVDEHSGEIEQSGEPEEVEQNEAGEPE